MSRDIGFNPHHTIPRDTTALKVVYYKGVEYEPEIKGITYRTQDVPHRMRNIKSLPDKVLKDPNFKDYTGHKYGNFTVVGMLHDVKFDKWVLRCSCGMYEIRRTSRINKPPERFSQEVCQSCLDLARLQHKDFYKKNQCYPWEWKKCAT